MWRLAAINSGFTKGRDLAGHETVAVPYVTVVNVQEGRFELSAVSETRLEPTELSSGVLKAGDVLMTEGGDRDKLGRGSIWSDEIPNCAFQNHIFRVRLDPDRYRPKFFHYLLQTQMAKRYFWAHAKQTSNLCTINSREVRRFHVPTPRIDEQDLIVASLERADRLVTAVAAERRAIEHLKRSLLQNMLVGASTRHEAAA